MNEYEHNDTMSNQEFPSDEAPAEQTSSAIGPDVSTAFDMMKDYHLKMIDIAQANAESAFDLARELLSAKTPSEFRALCAERVQKKLEQLSEQTAEMTELQKETAIPNVYIVDRPTGGTDGDGRTDFVVEDHAGQILGTFDMQMEAILWAKDAGYEALVACNSHPGDKNNPEHWRAF